MSRCHERLLAGDSVAGNDLPGLGLALLSRTFNAAEAEVLRASADALRQELAGDCVSYVINRNLNSSNHCELRCGFCAFRRDEGEPGAYRLSLHQLRERAIEARALGATELCLQAGLDRRAQHRGSHLAWAERLLQSLSAAAPGLHLHAFSPQELLFIAQKDALPLGQVLDRLQRAGLASVPGTAAEVLSERVRRVICPEKLSARSWVAVMLHLQQAGLTATSTLMAGHVELAADRVAHLLTLLALQRRAWQHQRCGFSEFVLLPFIGAAAPAPLRQRVGRDQPDVAAMLLLTAQARLLLGPWFVHHQPSWVKLTLPHAVEALRWGCDDIGGTLMEEHITTMAGATGGTAQSAQALRDAVRAIGRTVHQRSTLYGSVIPMAMPTPIPSSTAVGEGLTPS
ncbi:MAG: CofH family radical SAM protein [Cyanobium sp.]